MTSTPLDSNSSAPRIAWIGLGNLGSAIANHIVEKAPYTAPALIYNRTRSIAEQFCGERSNKTQVASSVEECVKQADIVFMNVSNDDAVKSIVDSALKAISNGEKKLFVDLSTIHPKTTDEIAAMIEKAGHDFVAGPIFGTPDVAEQGKVVVALAGANANVERASSAREELLYSDQPARVATTLKIIGNTFVFHVVESLSEAHVLAEKSGLGSANLHALIDVMYGGPFTAYSNRLMSGDYFMSVKWGAELALKDYGHAKSLAEEFGVQTKSLDVAAQHVRDVRDWAGEDEGRKGDISGVYGAVRMEGGLEFKNGGAGLRR